MQPEAAWPNLPIAPQRRLALAAQDILFRQGQVVSAMYYLESGRVRLVRHLEDGSSVILHVARGGESFAETSLFVGAYHCDAVAEVDSVILAVTKRDLLAAMGRSPDAALKLARRLALQLRDLRAMMEVRSIRGAPQRVLAWLCMNAKGNPPTVTLDRSWTSVAAEIGMTREALYRTLGRLQKSQQIIRTATSVTLADRLKGSRKAGAGKGGLAG